MADPDARTPGAASAPHARARGRGGESSQDSRSLALEKLRGGAGAWQFYRRELGAVDSQMVGDSVGVDRRLVMNAAALAGEKESSLSQRPDDPAAAGLISGHVDFS